MQYLSGVIKKRCAVFYKLRSKDSVGCYVNTFEVKESVGELEFVTKQMFP